MSRSSYFCMLDPPPYLLAAFPAFPPMLPRPCWSAKIALGPALDLTSPESSPSTICFDVPSTLSAQSGLILNFASDLVQHPLSIIHSLGQLRQHSQVLCTEALALHVFVR